MTIPPSLKRTEDNQGALYAQSVIRTEFLMHLQINIEYNISYIYHSLYAFFDRDNIGLPGKSAGQCEFEAEGAEHIQGLATILLLEQCCFTI